MIKFTSFGAGPCRYLVALLRSTRYFPCWSSSFRCSFHTLGVADQSLMRSFSRLFMRRIVREPLSASETASVAIAFSGLQDDVQWDSMGRSTTTTKFKSCCVYNYVQHLICFQPGRVSMFFFLPLACLLFPLSQKTQKRPVFFQVRDVGLFNATTLGLCRPTAVEALSWAELSEVAVAYASLRLYSQSLFGA